MKIVGLCDGAQEKCDELKFTILLFFHEFAK